VRREKDKGEVSHRGQQEKRGGGKEKKDCRDGKGAAHPLLGTNLTWLPSTERKKKEREALPTSLRKKGSRCYHVTPKKGGESRERKCTLGGTGKKEENEGYCRPAACRKKKDVATGVGSTRREEERKKHYSEKGEKKEVDLFFCDSRGKKECTISRTAVRGERSGNFFTGFNREGEKEEREKEDSSPGLSQRKKEGLGCV